MTGEREGSSVPDPSLIAVTFDLGKHGWGSCKLEIGFEAIEMTSISYVTDALGDLVRAALIVATGGGSADCIFEREPAGWRLSLSKEWSASEHVQRFRVRVSECDDTYRQLTEDDWRELFSGFCEIEAFAKAIENTASRVLAEHGADGYFEQWNQPFPIKALESLRVALRREDQNYASGA